MKRIFKIQQSLKVEKGRIATGAKVKYNFRNASDILEAVKPLLKENNLVVVMSDEVEERANRPFLKASVFIYDAENGSLVAAASGQAEIGQHIGMSTDQATGCASSYARKYALCGLFAIDDSKNDPDELDGDPTRAFNFLAANHAAAEYYRGIYGVTYQEMKPEQLQNIYNELVKNGKL